MVGVPIAVGLGNACDMVFAQLRKSAHKEDIVIAFQRGKIKKPDLLVNRKNHK